jgi:serine/threonine protein kinase
MGVSCTRIAGGEIAKVYLTDLHSGNILFRLQDLKGCSIEDIYRRFGEPLKLPVQRFDGQPPGREAPKYCVPPAKTFQACGDVGDDVEIVIADFGQAFLPDQPPKQLHTPVLLLPPESIFHEQLGPAVDVWTVGCTLYHILGGRHLFEGFMPDEDHVVAEMISTLDALPARWWDKWEKKGDFFLDDGSWKVDTHRAHAPFSRSLEERLTLMGREGEFCPDEATDLGKLIT